MNDERAPELPHGHVFVTAGKTYAKDMVWNQREFRWEHISGLHIGVSVGLFQYVCRRAP